ncbi:hypothetical protein BJF96_g10152 [Verticillium dahliae]|uniref:Uncharacterized protein n=1 Tax=Verticillium dahliae TaxID=27337 RepID=A0AA44W8A3_VERDA|nr:hypothetical protein BJF96_g10152 [Verticillium dahliae]
MMDIWATASKARMSASDQGGQILNFQHVERRMSKVDKCRIRLEAPEDDDVNDNKNGRKIAKKQNV